MDISPWNSVPTWSNGRVGEEGITKILDHILMNDHYATFWVDIVQGLFKKGLQITVTMILDLDCVKGMMLVPFKFNHSWLADMEFCQFVKDKWIYFFESVELPPMSAFVNKIFVVENISLYQGKGEKGSSFQGVSLY